MAPFGLLGHGQHLVDEWNKQILVEECISKNGIPGSASPPIVIADDADLSVHIDTETVNEETTIDQSVHGVSFINMHWASISTGISSILAVVILVFIVSGAATSGVGGSGNHRPATPKYSATLCPAPDTMPAHLSRPNQELT